MCIRGGGLAAASIVAQIVVRLRTVVGSNRLFDGIHIALFSSHTMYQNLIAVLDLLFERDSEVFLLLKN